MRIRFIAHAGIYVEEDGVSILIDPWFRDSTQENPVIESIGDSFKTIDFQIPQTTEKIENYSPDAILVSHFHPHHAPARDVQMLCENSLKVGKSISFLYPRRNEELEAELSKKLPLNVDRIPISPGYTKIIGPLTIEARAHSSVGHTCWYVHSKAGSVLHITDGSFNRDVLVRVPDIAWESLGDLCPSFLFINAGGHSMRRERNDGERYILEGSAFTAIEAATITQHIKPRSVGLIGFYNHSIWKGRSEYIRTAWQSLEEFEWARAWVAPHAKHVILSPGFEIEL